MALTDAQWAAVQVDVNVRLIAGTITEAQAVAELAAATEDWPTRSLSNADLALRVSKALANLGGLIETEGPPSMDVGAPGATAFDSVNIAFYGPKTVESWGAPRSLLGNPGPAIELRVSGGFIQWRVVGASTWVNLIALVDLKGADGQQVELRTNATHVQWRLGAETWADLIALAALKGADGREIELQKSATHIQWRYVGATDWTDLVPLADITPPPVPGPAAWTQEEAVVSDGERRVKQIVDWFGGDGAKPPVGQYLGAAGWVATAAEAEDIRGAGGSGSGDMQGSQNLAELTDVGAARTKLSVYSKAEVDTAIAGCATDGELSLLQDDVDALAATVAGISVPVKASGAELRTGTNDAKFLTAKSVTDAAAFVTTTWAASLSLDLSIPAQIVVLGGHTTLTAPTNAKSGVTARAMLKQPATGGPYTVSYASALLPYGTTPAASTAANAVDLMVMDPETGGKVRFTLQKGGAA